MSRGFPKRLIEITPYFTASATPILPGACRQRHDQRRTRFQRIRHRGETVGKRRRSRSGIEAVDCRKLLRDMFDAAVAAASPTLCVPKHLPNPPKGRTVVVGAGKAAASMAAAAEAHWAGPIEGLVVTPYGHNAPCRHIEVIEAAHPVPDAAGREAARRILEKVRGLGADDLVLCLFSGGGSALLALPAPAKV